MADIKGLTQTSHYSQSCTLQREREREKGWKKVGEGSGWKGRKIERGEVGAFWREDRRSVIKATSFYSPTL